MKTINTELSRLKTLLTLYLKEYEDSITEEEALQIINDVITSHCTIKKLSIDEYLKEFPFMVKQLMEYALDIKFVTTNEGIILTNDNKETIEEKTKRLEEMKLNTSFWNQWNAYCRHMIENYHVKENVIKNLDNDTDKILLNLPIPSEEVEFTIRGLVCGFVQSGKTRNYAALINKALDLGYDIIIILAGIPVILRNQAQKRMEFDVIGIDTLTGRRIGIGEKLENASLVEPLTKRDKKEPHGTKDLNGDVGRERMRHLPPYNGNKQIIFVVKKNVEGLTALYTWLKGLPIFKSGVNKIIDQSLLIVDDEADHCSNTGEKTEKPSAINREIRKILGLFRKNALVGYTATPFANIFLDPTEGDDLFPKDFIFLMQPPINYIGPFEFHGIDYNGSVIKRMPLMRKTDELDSFNGKTIHDWNYPEYGINPSLKVAINTFLLSGAIRRLRGYGHQHCSMLIHISTSMSSHTDVKLAVEKYLDEVKNSVFSKGKENDFWEEIEKLWLEDFIGTSKEMEEIDSNKFGTTVVYDMDFHFNEIKLEIAEFLKELEGVYKINSDKDADFLDYHGFEKENGRPLKVICVGGATLSRGVTIEGLTSSYYGRNSLQVDTVLQCGRFYGYRDGYRDLVRVYANKEIQLILRMSAQVVFQLITQFKQMEKKGETPKDFGFYIEDMLQGYLKPTSKKKMRRYEAVESSFSGFASDMASFKLDDKVSEHNQNVTANFISSLGTPYNENEISWRNVESSKVIDYLLQMKISKYSRFREALLLRDYIEEVNRKFNHLKYFDVVLVKTKRTKGENDLQIGPYNVSAVKRSASFVEDDSNYAVINGGRTISGTHLKLGLTEEQRNRYDEIYPNDNSITEKKVRPIRGEHGSIIIYTFCPDHINNTLKLKSEDKLKIAPIGFHIMLPECDKYENRKTMANLVYYLKNVLGGNVV
ncbi:Z1 domain-containing protein [Mesobacillus subterraneus]|uniref:Z1 domain-containing protein n=1 Tax=Mesobacillus subterraneus TaxID=285983 RepID=UPI001CFF0E66|nr:Z1 domain-containing protein [Mesobacillus subterraneus]WLR55937.1 Z1 domain-containing protein [Mesobacillus subterraneus]